ncbi:MAG: YdcF family protein [Rhodospirillaceae bacterium]|nr:YdcF family protein [Rhodospirillaceae bacterium]MDE0617947.1 YdcF family protein [Rhodospirillaceae bacterium]
MNRHAMTPVDRSRAFPHKRRKPWRALRWFAAICALAALLWLAGLGWFGFTMPQTPADGRTKTDAIVVLTGGSGRLAEGIRLLAAGAAPVLFVSGVDPRVDKQSVLRGAGGAPEEVHDRIVLGFRAEHTQGNADETALWARAQKLKSLRLVTANYHMRRSLLELRSALPGSRIVAHPVFPPAVSRGQWWRSVRGVAIVNAEFYKFAAALIRVTLAPAGPAGPGS